MDYEIKKATLKDKKLIIDYKEKTILDYENLSKEEKTKIKNYILTNVPRQLKNYQMIYVNNTIVGCLLVVAKDDGVLLDEIYLNENYRNKGIGTDILKEIILKNNIVYLFVYKLNLKAISLYLKLGFKIIDETETRYYMKYCK